MRLSLCEKLFAFTCEIHSKIFGVISYWHGPLLSARPANPQCNRRVRASEYLRGSILRPITRARLNTSAGSLVSVSIDHTKLSAYAVGVACWTDQFHTQARLRELVHIQFRRAIILGNSQINPPVLVQVRKGSAALFAIDPNASDSCVHRGEGSTPAPAQPQAASAILAGKV